MYNLTLAKKFFLHLTNSSIHIYVIIAVIWFSLNTIFVPDVIFVCVFYLQGQRLRNRPLLPLHRLLPQVAEPQAQEAVGEFFKTWFRWKGLVWWWRSSSSALFYQCWVSTCAKKEKKCCCRSLRRLEQHLERGKFAVTTTTTTKIWYKCNNIAKTNGQY